MNQRLGLLLALVAVFATGAAAARATARMQPWRSPDGRVRLSRPAGAIVERAAAPINTLMRPGWRLFWGEGAAPPGSVIVRLTLRVHPEAPGKTASELLQVGVSSDPRARAGCLHDDLNGGSGERLPDRVINGVRYRAWHNADEGMSQSIDAIDLRAVVDGACYAVERFSVGEGASDGDPSVTLPQAKGAALLDASLASPRIGARAR